MCFSVSGQKIRPFYGPFPEPAPNKKRLFYLQRTVDRNTVIYELNYDPDGRVNEKKPLNVFWIDFEDGAKISPLTFAQSKFAYGVGYTVRDKINMTYEIYLVSYKKIKIQIKRTGKENLYQAHASIKGRPAVLTRIYVNITGGTYFKPLVKYIELSGEDVVSGLKVSEQFRPDANEE